MGPNGNKSASRQPWTGTVRRPHHVPAPGAKLLAERRLAAAVAICALLLVGLQQVEIAAWRCPVDALSGRPCPGCGLTRAVGQLLCGHWRTALKIHPLAPAAAAAVALSVVVAVLPRPSGRRVAAAVERVERRSGCTVLVMAAMLALWGAGL